MSVMSQCIYSALIMNKLWTQYDQITDILEIRILDHNPKQKI